MPVTVRIYHRTVYKYDRPVFLTTHLFRLKPAAHSPARVENLVFEVHPAEHYHHLQQDVFGNFVDRIDFKGLMEEMSATVNLTATIVPFNPFDFFVDQYAGSYPFQYPDKLRKALSPYLERVEGGPRLQALAAKALEFSGPVIPFLVAVNALIKEKLKYTIRLEPGVQTSEQSLQFAVGSCRDSAWLLVQLLRQLGLASRFVSGYLVQVSGGGTTFTDSIDLHAWTEVYLPGAGWVGMDPTSGLLAGEGHIPLACTTYPEDAAPVTGTTDPCFSAISYKGTVTRI